MAEFATLEDLRLHLNKVSTVDDGELADMLAAAEDLVRDIVGSFTLSTVTERVPVVAGTAILAGRPTGAVTVDGGEVTGFTVNAAAGLLEDLPASGRVTVTYETGGGEVPAAVRVATVIVAAHLWETQRGTSPTPLSPVGDVDVPFPGTAGFAIPNRAKELLQPYARRASQVA